jgi:hypothetical protein
MTHCALYDLDSSVEYVFHVHSPGIWRNAGTFDIPGTKAGIEYGTPEMAEEMRRLFRESPARFRRIISLGGHEDGIISFGRSPEEAGLLILRYLARSLENPSER